MAEMVVASGSPKRRPVDASQRNRETPPAATTQDRPEVCRRQPNFTMRNRMREICSSGSVRGGDGNVPTYSAKRVIADPELAGIVRDNDHTAQQAMVADRAPDAGFAKHPDQRFVKDIDPLA